jgi:hypothetical protein
MKVESWSFSLGEKVAEGRMRADGAFDSLTRPSGTLSQRERDVVRRF